jgi:hypothetical protein
MPCLEASVKSGIIARWFGIRTVPTRPIGTFRETRTEKNCRKRASFSPDTDRKRARQHGRRALQITAPQMSRLAAANTIPVTNAAKQENTRKSCRILIMAASPAPTLVGDVPKPDSRTAAKDTYRSAHSIFCWERSKHQLRSFQGIQKDHRCVTWQCDGTHRG